MHVTIPLPDLLPQNGFDLEIHLRRVPEASCSIKALLNSSPELPGVTRPVYVYGRGKGSPATEKAHLLAHVNAEMVRQSGAQANNTVSLVVQDLAGNPLDAVELDIESVRIR